MKIRNWILCALLSTTISAAAQNTDRAQEPGYAAGWHTPRGVLRIDDSSALKSDYLNDININAARDFVKRFSAAASPRWIRLQDGSFIARFEEPGIAGRAAYSKRGVWVYTIRSYHEKQLSHEVRHIVKSTYYDFAIIGVDEITQYNIDGPVYAIYLEGDSSYLTLRVHNGEMEVAQELYKKKK